MTNVHTRRANTMREDVVAHAIVSSLRRMQWWSVDIMIGRTTHMVFATTAGAKSTLKRIRKKTENTQLIKLEGADKSLPWDTGNNSNLSLV